MPKVAHEYLRIAADYGGILLIFSWWQWSCKYLVRKCPNIWGSLPTSGVCFFMVAAILQIARWIFGDCCWSLFFFWVGGSDPANIWYWNVQIFEDHCRPVVWSWSLWYLFGGFAWWLWSCKYLLLKCPNTWGSLPTSGVCVFHGCCNPSNSSMNIWGLLLITVFFLSWWQWSCKYLRITADQWCDHDHCGIFRGFCLVAVILQIFGAWSPKYLRITADQLCAWCFCGLLQSFK